MKKICNHSSAGFSWCQESLLVYSDQQFLFPTLSASLLTSLLQSNHSVILILRQRWITSLPHPGHSEPHATLHLKLYHHHCLQSTVSISPLYYTVLCHIVVLVKGSTYNTVCAHFAFPPIIILFWCVLYQIKPVSEGETSSLPYFRPHRK